MKAIVSVTNDLYTDQRVHKVCTFIQSQGYEVLLVGRLRKDSKELERTYQTKRFRLPFDKGPLFYASYSFRLFWFLLFSKCDVLVSNDLDTLLPNYLASKIKSKKLVYDSHEYFTEVPELVNRPKVQAIWERIEGFIFPKLKHVYTVNQSIACKYENKYGVPLLVVRNISPKWNSTLVKTKKELGIPENKFVLIFQGAGINIDRGGEEAVKSMQYLKDAVLLFVGDGDVVPYLKKLTAELNLEKSVFFFGKRPYLEMMNFTHHADLGITLDKNTNINYRFSLPNKVFDYMHANTPILASDLIEVKKVVVGYDIGMITPTHDPMELGNIIQKIQNSPNQLVRWKENCVKASLIENWESEVRKLEAFYPNVKTE